ncbi:MAG: 2-C-methyl-D-erythritol 2,4-cyclodiphosphate synthase [Clostridia bacterium]|nr:2-C-methyl-D-erythritol 2,4-cyclodiphosphate synthase [Clostridia bacterium]
MERIKVTAIIAAAGKGSRSGLNENKIFYNLDGEPVILKTVKIFDETPRIDEIIIVYSEGEKERIEGILSPVITKPIRYVLGGKTRFLSVKNALSTIDSGAVIIHDAARPHLYKDILSKCVKSVLVDGSAVVGSTPTDTIMQTDNKDNIIESLRVNRWLAKTPQCFMVDKLKKAYDLAGDGEGFTDDAGVYCAFIGKCKLIKDDSENKKLTHPCDFTNSTPTCVGVGYDLHRLGENRKLILGGVEIKHDKGLIGHSDADVLTHAIMDALLSSASLRDIGYHFSDKDAKYKDISSMVLLDKVMEMLKEKGVKPLFVSAVIMAEKPKLIGYIPEIQKNLAKALSLPIEKVGITATTLEGIGIVGREEGIASNAYVLCYKEGDL